jgi:uncharacterized protein (UPF0332 family)
MTPTNKDELITYRIDRAKITLNSAESMLSNTEFPDGNSVSNRLYYACFYAILALLASIDITVKSHKTAKSLLGLHFIQTGLIETKYGRMFNNLFDLRQDSDYSDMFLVEISEIQIFVSEAKMFIEIVEKLLINKQKY